MDELTRVFAADGALARHLESYRARPQQLALAQAVAECFSARDTLIAEAGTGTGKTFAYLVPALLGAQRVIISTGTKTLQDQLYKRDVPALQQMLNPHKKVRLLKGRSNYLCLERLYRTAHSRQGRVPTFQRLYSEIIDWLPHTQSGEIAELRQLTAASPHHHQITSTADNCLGSECEHYSDCFVYRARRSAQQADLLIVNYHLLFADMALKKGGFGDLLPACDAVVIDEAHQIPQVAGRFFSQALSSRQLRDLATDVTAEAHAVSAAFAGVESQLSAFEQGVRNVLLVLLGQSGKGALAELWRDAGVRNAFQSLHRDLGELAAALQSLAEASSGLAACAARASEAHARLEDFLNQSSTEDIYWHERAERYFILHKTPLDVATPLREFTLAQDLAWVLTSATLAVDGSFENFMRQTGFNTETTLQLDSPFDYAGNAVLHIPESLPEPNDTAFNARLFEYLTPLIRATAGGVFFLFTSHRSLSQAATHLHTRAGKNLYVQGTQDRNALLQAFRADGAGLLLGTTSFWEGVDVSGPALRCVIIDRLPFAHPDDPVLKARADHIRRSGGQPFFQQQLPEAVIALKQGAGRLIRGETDTGVLIICDRRLRSKPYGRVFLNSLPITRQEPNCETILQTLEKAPKIE